jgi:hypothetical protein
MHILLPLPQVHDRIADQLARIVAGYVAAPVRADYLHPLIRQPVFISAQIFEAPAAAGGNDGKVFNQYESAVKFAVTDQAPGISLQTQPIIIINEPSLYQGAASH